MGAFEDVHAERITGSLAMYDRMIFKGHLTALFKQDGARCYLWSQGVALKDFTPYAKATTAQIADHCRALATSAGRPVISFDHVKTRNRTQPKDDLAKSIAERDGVSEGIVCLISAVEPCMSFQVRKRMTTGHLEIFRRERACLHHYLYLIDPEFGFMHIRIQGWLPYEVQVYINGREWLARALDKAGVGYVRYENSLLRIDDLDGRLAAVRALRPPGLAPGPQRLRQDGEPAPGPDQRRRLRRLLLGARPGRDRHRRDVQDPPRPPRGLARPRPSRRPQPGFRGRARLSRPKAPPLLGRRGGHRRQAPTPGLAGAPPHGRQLGEGLRQGLGPAGRDHHQQSARVPVPAGQTDAQTAGASGGGVEMRKGVGDLWRNYQVGIAANSRYLDALAAAPLKGEGVAALDALCRPTNQSRTNLRPVQPTHPGRLGSLQRRLGRGAHHQRLPQRGHRQTSLPTTAARPSTRPTDDANGSPDSSSNSEVTAWWPRCHAHDSIESPHYGNSCDDRRHCRARRRLSRAGISPRHDLAAIHVSRDTQILGG